MKERRDELEPAMMANAAWASLVGLTLPFAYSVDNYVDDRPFGWLQATSFQQHRARTRR